MKVVTEIGPHSEVVAAATLYITIYFDPTVGGTVLAVSAQGTGDALTICNALVESVIETAKELK